MNLYTQLSRDSREYQLKTSISLKECEEQPIEKPIETPVTESEDSIESIEELIKGLEDELNNTSDSDEKKQIQEELTSLRN